MDNFPSEIEAPEPSYNLSSYDKDGIVISSGPKNGLLWRGEAFDKKMPLIESLNKVFTLGFTQGNEQSILSSLAYIKEKYPNSIYASYTYSSKGEFFGLEQEELAAGMYGYIYLIDTRNLKSIPLCEENLINPNFIAGCPELISEGPEHVIISQIDNRIIGAIPSAFIAFALGIPERSFIKNPGYNEILDFGKLKEYLGISLLSELNTLTLKYPNLSIDEVYKKFLEVDDKLVTAQSYSEVVTGGNSTFFKQVPLTSGLDSIAYNSQLKF